MVEKWLQQVEQMMLASMQEVIRLGIEAYVQVNENWDIHARVLVQQPQLWVKWISYNHPSVFYQNPR